LQRQNLYRAKTLRVSTILIIGLSVHLITSFTYQTSSTGNSDPYCVVSVDNEKLGKTQTIWRTVNPCWLKDFNFDIPVNAKSVHFTIYDRDKAKQGAKLC